MNKLLTHRWLQFVILSAVLLSLVAFSFSNARWREQIRNFSFDNYNIIKPRQPSGEIVIVDIDEVSLEKVGQMPWPRTEMARLVENLKEMGARLIVFDIVFAEEDRSSPAAMIDMVRTLPDADEILPRFENLRDNDTVFGLTIGEAKNVVTGFSFTNEKTGDTPRQKGIFRGKDLERYVPRLTGATANLKTISRFAAGNGSFFVSTDTDGIIRRVPMLIAHQKAGAQITTIYPSLSLEVIRVLDDVRGGRVVLADDRYAALDPSRFGIEEIIIGKGGEARHIPTNARGEFPVYFAKSNPDWYISAHEILDKSYPAQDIKDKIVFIGTSAVGLKDIRSTPLDTFIPGVEVHLNIVDQVLQGSYLSRSIAAEGIEAVTILIAGFLIILLVPYIGALMQTLFVTFVLLSIVAGGWYAFSVHGVLIDVAYPFLSVLGLFTFSIVMTYLRSEQERRAVRQAFGLYISPDFMRELTKDPSRLQLGGEIRDLTVMFTDIRRFTAISEGLPPQELIQLMNDFLTPMSELVMGHRGTIDKYMGDAMMAFWNAPLDDPDHVRHACLAALKMQAAIDPINEAVKKRAQDLGKMPVLLQAGIGINTGPCAVGNMGSRQRFAYSALGDAVNLASRLEGQTKIYGANILIGEDTWRDISDFASLEVDVIRVKGKTQPVRMFALLGDEALARDTHFQAWQKDHNEMISSYRSRDFAQAKKSAIACLKNNVGDLQKTYEIYIRRCDDFINSPPDDDWDGVCEAREK